MNSIVKRCVAWGEKRYGKIIPCDNKTWSQCLVKRDNQLEFWFNLSSGTTRMVILVPKNGYYQLVEPKNEAEVKERAERDRRIRMELRDRKGSGSPGVRSFSSHLHSWQGNSEGTFFINAHDKPKETYGNGSIKVYC
jgi:hypothetical protein